MCQLKGASGSRLSLAGKSTHKVDGIGKFTGMGIITSGAYKLKQASEKEAWVAGQKSALGMLQYYRKKAAEGDDSAAERIQKTIDIIKGYAEFTGETPSVD